MRSGCSQLNVAPNLWLDLAGGACRAALPPARSSALFISHRRGIYYALLTIAFGQVFWFVAIKWHGVTGGEDGLLNIAPPAGRSRPRRVRPHAATTRSSTSCLVVFVAAVVGLWRLVHSPFGRVLAAIRQNETRAAFVGYHVWLYKWLAFTISAARRRAGRRAVRDGAAVRLSRT